MRTFKKDLVDFTTDLANDLSSMTLIGRKDQRAVKQINRIVKACGGSTEGVSDNIKYLFYNLVSVHEYKRVLNTLSDMACQMQKEREEYNSLVDDIKSTSRYLKKK
jgi:hypothetical protein